MRGSGKQYTYLADGSLRVNDEQATEGNTFLFDQNTIIFRQLVVLITIEGNVDASETTVFARGRGPREKAAGEVSPLAMYAWLHGDLRQGRLIG